MACCHVGANYSVITPMAENEKLLALKEILGPLCGLIDNPDWCSLQTGKSYWLKFVLPSILGEDCSVGLKAQNEFLVLLLEGGDFSYEVRDSFAPSSRASHAPAHRRMGGLHEQQGVLNPGSSEKRSSSAK